MNPSFFNPCCFSPSSLIFHPSFFSPPQSSVRNEVMATSHVTDEWMTLMEMSSLNCYIVRRYIATPSGVLRIYPGSLMDKAFDPTRRQWWGLLWWVWKGGQDDVKGVWSFVFGLRRWSRIVLQFAPVKEKQMFDIHSFSLVKLLLWSLNCFFSLLLSQLLSNLMFSE